MTTARVAMFITHNNVASPCRIDPSRHWLLSFRLHSLFRAFLNFRNPNAPISSGCEQWLQVQTQKATKQPLQVKQLKMPLTQTIDLLRSGSFGLYQLTGEV